MGCFQVLVHISTWLIVLGGCHWEGREGRSCSDLIIKCFFIIFALFWHCCDRLILFVVTLAWHLKHDRSFSQLAAPFSPHWFSDLRQFSSSLLSEQSSSSSHLQMVGIHLLLLHWNCPSSHSSVAGNKREREREKKTTRGENRVQMDQQQTDAVE